MLTVYSIILAVMSVLAIIIFAVDKIASKENRKRVPESVLLSLISFGGAAGGIIGMYVFRHKTVFRDKFQFGIGLWISLIIQIAVGIFLALVQSGTVSFK